MNFLISVPGPVGQILPMATSEMHVEEVVVVTTPDGVGEAATSVDDLKTVLVDVDLTHAG